MRVPFLNNFLIKYYFLPLPAVLVLETLHLIHDSIQHSEARLRTFELVRSIPLDDLRVRFVVISTLKYAPLGFYNTCVYIAVDQVL